jgi:hypothetical protein
VFSLGSNPRSRTSSGIPIWQRKRFEKPSSAGSNPAPSTKARVAQSAGGTTLRPSAVWVRIPPRVPIPKGAFRLNGRPPVPKTGMDTRRVGGSIPQRSASSQCDWGTAQTARLPCLPTKQCVPAPGIRIMPEAARHAVVAQRQSSALVSRRSRFETARRLPNQGKCHLRGAGCRP